MKTKKKSVVIASVAVIVVTLCVILLSVIFKDGLSNITIRKYLDNDIENIDNISPITHCAEVENQKNSVAGVKESVRLGADAVVVDICFRSDSTPVLTDSYSSADTAQPAEDLFKAMNEEKYKELTVYLNIIQLSDMSQLNALAARYKVIDRLFITGINEDRYGLIDSDETIVPFFLDYSPDAAELSAAENGSFDMPECIEEFGATGLILNSAYTKKELITAFGDYGIPIIVRDFSNDRQFCSVIKDGATLLYVEDIERSREILDKWAQNMLNRNEKSIENSIKSLSAIKK